MLSYTCQSYTRLQLMWIAGPVLGHSFLACNLLWPCSFSETEWDSLIAIVSVIFEVSSSSLNGEDEAITTILVPRAFSLSPLGKAPLEKALGTRMITTWRARHCLVT